MAERDLTRTGVRVDFFGEPTLMPAGPAKLAIETGAALLPAHCWFPGNSWRVDIYPALDTTSGDVGAITQELADHFGTLETIRGDIGVLFTRLNVALATHAAARGTDGQDSAQWSASSREARVPMDTLPPHQGGSAEIRHLSSAQN